MDRGLMIITHTSKSKQLKMSSKHYASCMFGNFERALQDNCRQRAFSISWDSDCLNDALSSDDVAKLAHFIKKELKHHLRHFKHYSRRFKIKTKTFAADVVGNKLHISGLIVVREN